jgi:hypothetical protein
LVAGWRRQQGRPRFHRRRPCRPSSASARRMMRSKLQPCSSARGLQEESAAVEGAKLILARLLQVRGARRGLLIRDGCALSAVQCRVPPPRVRSNPCRSLPPRNIPRTPSWQPPLCYHHGWRPLTPGASRAPLSLGLPALLTICPLSNLDSCATGCTAGRPCWVCRTRCSLSLRVCPGAPVPALDFKGGEGLVFARVTVQRYGP